MATNELSNIMTRLQTKSVDATELLAKDKASGEIVKVDGNSVAKASDVVSNLKKIGSLENIVQGNLEPYSLGVPFIGSITSQGSWNTNASYTGKSYFVEVGGFESVSITGNSVAQTYYSFVKNIDGIGSNVGTGTLINFADGYDGIVTVRINEKIENIKVPDDARYLYVLANGNNRQENESLPAEIFVNGFDIISKKNNFTPLAETVGILEENVGRRPSTPKEEYVDTGDALDYAVRKVSDVGRQLSFYTATSTSHREFSCEKNTSYEITTTVSTSGNYRYFVHVVDSERIVTQVFLDNTETGAGEQTVRIKTSEKDVKIIVSDNHPKNSNSSVVKKIYFPSLYQNIEILENVDAEIKLKGENLDSEMYKSAMDDRHSYIVGNGLFESSLGEFENSLIKTATNKIDKLSCLNIALITDTHYGSSYFDRNLIPWRSIEALKKVAAKDYIHLCVHCGDVATSYGSSRETLGLRIKKALEQYKGISKNMFIVKGNHDANDNGSDPDKIEADMSCIDWSSEEYYVMNKDNSYNRVTENTWDNISQLYVSKNRLAKLFPDIEFNKVTRNFIGEVVYDEVNQTGGYFYQDFDSYNVRVVVLNAYQVDENGTYRPTTNWTRQMQWLSNIAFDVDAQKHVIIFMHCGVYDFDNVTMKNSLSNEINSFVSRGGNFIGVFHGHTHSYEDDSSESGFNDIGFTLGARRMDSTGTKEGYGIDILSIDTSNRRVHDIVINQEIDDRTFEW